MRRLALVLVVAAALGSACGERPGEQLGAQPDREPADGGPATPLPPTQLMPPTGPTPDPDAALAAWQQFPVDRRPRPIVLLGSLPGIAGFMSDGGKIAALSGNYELAAALPPAPPTVTAQLPDGTFELPTLPAEQAFEGLRKPQGKQIDQPAPNPTDALPITRVELGTAQFLTDRGQLTLPSWLFHAVDALGPITWPALRPDAFWRPGELAAGGVLPDARLGADGRALTVQLPAPVDACPGEPVIRHDPVVTESAATVVVGVRPVVVSTAPGPPVTNCAHPAILKFEPHEVRLAAPLGARVLVDDKGAPMAVTP
jgi:hypothetical protein